MVDKPDTTLLQGELPDVRILEEVDSGGFKIVYKSLIHNRTEALKVVQIPIDPANEDVREENQKRIFREISILSQCESPFIVKLGSISPREMQISGKHYVVYSEEFIDGTSLRSLLNVECRPTFQEVRLLTTILLQTVQKLKIKNVIHRDIKPNNIMKTDDPHRPYILLDFGIAFLIGGSNLTQNSRHVPGTLYYIAPEMLDIGFRQNLDYRADLYAIGLTVYEYSSGINPFAKREDPQFTTLYRIKTETPVPLLTLREDFPPEFCNLIDNLMKKLPALRPANMNALVKKLENME